MKTYNKIYERICSLDNLILAWRKARKGKTKEDYVIKFEENLEENLLALQKELIEQKYIPHSLRSFIIRDPKTRKIHSSIFKDRIVHHVIVNIIEPIFEKIFIYDSYASRKNKGTHKAIDRFKDFMRKVSANGRLIKNALNNNNNNMVEGYVLKADIKHYFDEVNHDVLINIIKKKIDDEKTIKLLRKILDNFNSGTAGNSQSDFEINSEIPLKSNFSGMPLGNLTSQFFANIYLNELDYFVKHKLKAKYYLRYVDDFVILHRNKKRLECFKKKIQDFLKTELKIELHPDKTKVLALRNGIIFLGYRIFFHYTLLNKKNIKLIKKKVLAFKENKITEEDFNNSLTGWDGYAKWANSHNLRKKLGIFIYPSQYTQFQEHDARSNSKIHHHAGLQVAFQEVH
jgi:retron-type reverse transcriptase